MQERDERIEVLTRDPEHQSPAAVATTTTWAARFHPAQQMNPNFVGLGLESCLAGPTLRACVLDGGGAKLSDYY